jgi:hypothetical protein
MTCGSGGIAETIHSLACRILPSDETPGAYEAQVIGYIEWLLRQRFFARHQGRMCKGVAALDQLATAQFQQRFADCHPEQQDELLRNLASEGPPDAKNLLDLVIHIAIAGFLCSPDYGGNKDGLGWKHVGFQLRRAGNAA